MVAATKSSTTPTAQAERLIALYRIEHETRMPCELLEDLTALPNMKRTTRASIWEKINRPRCADSTVLKMAELAIREMVDRGHASDVEAFIDQEAIARVRCNLGLNGTAPNDERDLFVVRALDLKASNPEAYAAMRGTLGSLVTSTGPSNARAKKIAGILSTASRVDAAFPRTSSDREEGNSGSTEIMLTNAIEAADEGELATMLEAVLNVASDRVVNAVDDVRKREERMLAEFHAERGAA